MANPITIYPNPKNFRALSYKEVQDRIRSFDINKISNIWVFYTLNDKGKNIAGDFNMRDLIEMLNDSSGEKIAFIERIS